MSLIVVVDDQGSNQRIYSKLASLVGDDISVKTFGSPFEMLGWLENSAPDLVITDFKMPGMDGAELTRRLRARPEGADVPVIVLTAYEDQSFRLTALEAGATDFIQTPVNHEEFVSRARNLLKLRHQQQSIKREAQKLERRLRDSEYSREMAMRDSREQLAQVIDTVPALISATDRDGYCVFVNAMFAVYARREPAGCVGLPASGLLMGGDAARNKVAERAVLTRGQAFPGYEERIQDPSGAERSFLTSKSPLFDAQGAVVGVLTTSLDITDQKMAHERLRHLAQHDALTGLPNRTFLSNRLQQLLDESRGAKLSALHLLDLDRFKSVNDTLGHYVGDQLLQQVADLLKPFTNQTTTLARLGGDEFALLQEDIPDMAEAERLAAQVVAVLSRPFEVARHRISTTASLGIALVGQDGSDVNELLKNADLAMYQAKMGGRNRYQFFAEQLRARVNEAALLEAGMRDALVRNEFVLHYQPQLDLLSGRIVGVEALVRWNHPERGLLPPGAFLGIAEETGLVAQISDWVLRRACRQLAEWQERGVKGLRMAVNVSPAQFNHHDIGAAAEAIIRETGIRPSDLEVELTENVFVDQTEDAAHILGTLKANGIGIALDDFGTGFSSLRLVRELPVDALKIDRSFVRNLPQSKEDAAIVRAIIRLGHGLGLRIVAEGVENADQLAFLKKEGCDDVQGFYFSRPVPAEACLVQILERNLGTSLA